MRRISALLGLFALLLGGMAITATTASAGGGGQTHVFVCKYVGTPGVDETLKDGKQPIYVASDATVGTYFNDAQGRSYVLAIADETNTDPQGKTYTGDLTCPAPEGPKVVTPDTPDVTPPTCTADGTLVLPDGPEGVIYKVKPVYDGPGEYTVTAKALKGYVLAPAEHGWSWDLTVLPKLTGEQCQTTPPPPVVTPGPPNPQAKIATVCGHATFTLSNLTPQTTDQSATFVTTINGKDSTTVTVKAGDTQTLEYGQTTDVGVVHLGVKVGGTVLATADMETKCGQGGGTTPPAVTPAPETTPVAETLPHTGGGNAVPIALAGALLLGLGSAATVWATRRKGAHE